MVRSLGVLEKVRFANHFVQCGLDEFHLRRVHLVFAYFGKLVRHRVVLVAQVHIRHQEASHDRHQHEIEQIEEKGDVGS